VILTLLVFFPLLQIIAQNWEAVRASFERIAWLPLAGSVLLLGIVLPWMASISWACLHSLGAHLPLRQVFGLYFVTQLPKYLPGGIWAFPGRMLAYQAVGVQPAPAVVSVFREVSALFLGAVIIGLLALFQDIVLDPALQLTLIIGLLACLGATGILQLKAFWKLALRLPFLKSTRLAQLASQTDDLCPHQPGLFSLAWLPGALVCSLVFWLGMGVPFRQLMVAISPAATGLSWLQAATLFALSWCIGFAVVFVPAGFGVRESALTLLLSRIVPLGDAVSIALLSRLWWMVVEAVCIAVSVWLLGDVKWSSWKRIGS